MRSYKLSLLCRRKPFSIVICTNLALDCRICVLIYLYFPSLISMSCMRDGKVFSQTDINLKIKLFRKQKQFITIVDLFLITFFYNLLLNTGTFMTCSCLYCLSMFNAFFDFTVAFQNFFKH